MKKWLNNFKDKVSDWYYDGDLFYLRTIVNPFLELGKNITNYGQRLSEYATPIYSDIIAGADVLEGGVLDIQNGNYLSGAGKVIISPVVTAAALAAPDGLDVPLKGSAKLSKPLHVYTGKKLGEKAGRGRPASNINEVTGLPITMLDVVDAMRNNGRTIYNNTSEEAIKSAAIQQAADKRSKYLLVLESLDRKANKVKSDWDRKRGLNLTKTRAGKVETSFLPKVTAYLEEVILSTFKPSLKAVKKGTFDSYYDDFLLHISNLGYDTTTKESLEAINKIALSTSWGKSLPSNKQGGILNYLNLFK